MAQSGAFFVHAQDGIIFVGAHIKPRRNDHLIITGLTVDMFDTVDPRHDGFQGFGDKFDRIIGGEPVGKRHIWWNFVHSDPERIEAAKQRWVEQRFPTVPGDHDVSVPLPAD